MDDKKETKPYFPDPPAPPTPPKQPMGSFWLIVILWVIVVGVILLIDYLT